MSEDQPLALADIPAGPELAAALARLGQRRGELDGARLVEFIVATQRLNDWTDALQVSNVNELAYCPPAVPEPDAPRLEHRSDLVPGVVEAALGWSRGRARRYDNTAYLLAELFPATHAALAEGLIDWSAARVIADGIAVLDHDDVREAIEAAILTWLRELRAQGRKMTTRTIARHVEKAVIEADPAAAKKRHKDRVNRRDVHLKPNVDSAADLTLYDLPADVAVRIYNRIDATAKALKRHGDPRRIGQLRADIAASLLLGESRYITPDEAPTDDTAAGTDNDAGETDDTPGAAGDANNADTGVASTPSSGPTPTPTPAVWRDPVPVRARNVLHVSLTALLGLHDLGKTDPAILGGFGPVIDEVAERILANHLDNPDARYDILVTHPRTGKPLQLHSVDARLVTGRRRDAVGTRWPTCVFPSGCTRPADHCVIDHSHDYAHGGKTEEANADPICPAHEREKTRNGWRQQREGHDHDLIIWIDPFGNRYPVPAPRYAITELEPEPPPEPEPDPGPPF